MARKAILSFSDIFPHDTVANFAMRLARRYGIVIGDQYAPVDPSVMGFVAPSAIIGYREMSGRWIARCECGGAEVVEPNTAIFMCCSCFNEEHRRQWRNVIFPDYRLEIEELLAARPGALRHWAPGESIEQLKAENAELKVG